MNTSSQGTGRFLTVVDTSLTDLRTAEEELRKRGLKTVERMEFIDTLVIEGEAASAESAAREIPGIRSIEKEGTVHTQR